MDTVLESTFHIPWCPHCGSATGGVWSQPPGHRSCSRACVILIGTCLWHRYFLAATTLTSWHLGVTYFSLHFARRLKLFEHKPFDSRTVIGFAILNGISIGLLNLSLGFNSVGFYQVSICLQPANFKNPTCVRTRWLGYVTSCDIISPLEAISWE